jgi:multimeric flavodoxin WrbA
MALDEIDINIFAKDNCLVFGDGLSLDVIPGDVCRNRQEPAAQNDPCTKSAGPMKVVSINTSHDKGHSGIAGLLDPFLEGMKEAGADVELYYSRDLVIFPCCGNLNCTIKTPGKCMAYDDMRWLRQKIGQADILVLASPLYFNGLIGPEGATPSMKSLLGRLIPGKSPSADEPYEHAVHTTKEPVCLRKIVFVSSCGFWEIDDFYPVLTHIKALCYNTFPEFAGNINTVHGVLLRGALEAGASERDVLELARSAGRQLAQGAKEPDIDAARRILQTTEIYHRIMGKQAEIECR